MLGETGTGKELVAQTDPLDEPPRKEAFVPVNCGAVSPDPDRERALRPRAGQLHRAPTASHRGYFERANRGTLFLDEITEMPPELQVKLLRVLETGTLSRVGGTETLNVDVRVIAATNRRPEEAVAAGKLREDLLYRLNVFPIELPPLRERREDIELLAQHFLDEPQQGGRHGQALHAAPRSQRLRTHSWPGNVRELQERRSSARTSWPRTTSASTPPARGRRGDAAGDRPRS